MSRRDRDVLADKVLVAYFETTTLTRDRLPGRIGTKDHERMDHVTGAEDRLPVEGDMRDQTCSRADLDRRANHAKGADDDVITKLSPGIDTGRIGDLERHGRSPRSRTRRPSEKRTVRVPRDLVRFGHAACSASTTIKRNRASAAS